MTEGDRGEIRVEITPQELQEARTLAAGRMGSKLNPHGFTDNVSKLSKFDLDVLGILGEMCVAKRWGGTFNREFTPFGDGNKPDVILPGGIKVEVKAVSWRGWDVEMKFSPNEFGKAPAYCLVQVFVWTHALIFPIRSRRFVEERLKPRNYRHGPRLAFSPPAV